MNEFLFGTTDDGTVLLTTAGNAAELMLLRGLLDDNDVRYMLKDREACDLRVLGGSSIFGTDIRVTRDDYERARELIDAYASGAVIEPEPEPEQE